MDGGAADPELGAWMQAAQRGDAEAYRQLLRACLPMIAATVRSQGLSGDRVEDAVQDTLLTIHRARATYDPARPFLPWVRAIAKRRAIDVLRQQGRRSTREIHDPISYETAAAPAGGDALETQDRARKLREAVERLPPGQRQAVEQLALGEKSLDEVAALTGRGKGALKVNLHRALKSLRVRLSGDADV